MSHDAAGRPNPTHTPAGLGGADRDLVGQVNDAVGAAMDFYEAGRAVGDPDRRLLELADQGNRIARRAYAARERRDDAAFQQARAEGRTFLHHYNRVVRGQQ